MLSKKEIKDIQSLSLKKQRDEIGQFVAEGPKVVKELVQAIPKQIKMVYATKEWLDQNVKVIEKTKTVLVTDTELERISQMQTPNKVVAVCRKFTSVEPTLFSFVLYLDTIQDPGNFGTLVRIADWFGIKNIVCSSGCADLYNPKVIQSSMASIASVEIYYDENNEWLQKQKMPIYAATLNGNSLYGHSKITQGILLIGNESKGLRTEFISLATEQITIPKKGNAESLNAAVAAGIILSHLL